jgi:hypothetical protein
MCRRRSGGCRGRQSGAGFSARSTFSQAASSPFSVDLVQVHVYSDADKPARMQVGTCRDGVGRGRSLSRRGYLYNEVCSASYPNRPIEVT